jgi:hypothetical protein
MEKYLIVETFNGAGYSDSSAKIVEFASLDEAREHALSMARDFAEEGSPLEILEDRIIYGVNGDDDMEYDEEYPLDKYEDHGAVHFVKLESDTVGILIEPTINEFSQLKTLDVAEVVTRLLESEESQDGEHVEGTCHHLDDSVEIYFRIDSL